jgi:hypothetical protein
VKKLLGTSTLKLELAGLDAYLPSNCVIAMLPAVRSVLGGTKAESTCGPVALVVCLAEPKLVRVRRRPTYLIPLLAKPTSIQRLGNRPTVGIARCQDRPTVRAPAWLPDVRRWTAAHCEVGDLSLDIGDRGSNESRRVDAARKVSVNRRLPESRNPIGHSLPHAARNGHKSSGMEMG